MDNKHKQVFQELREWCEKWNAEIYIEDCTGSDAEMYVKISNEKYYSLDGFFGKHDREVVKLDGNFERINYFNFMEQEDDNTEE